MFFNFWAFIVSVDHGPRIFILKHPSLSSKRSVFAILYWRMLVGFCVQTVWILAFAVFHSSLWSYCTLLTEFKTDTGETSQSAINIFHLSIRRVQCLSSSNKQWWKIESFYKQFTSRRHFPTKHEASFCDVTWQLPLLSSFTDSELVVRATHNISQGEEITHCYGKHMLSVTLLQSTFRIIKRLFLFILNHFTITTNQEVKETNLYNV